MISFHGVGLSVAEEMKYEDITAQMKDVDEVRSLWCMCMCFGNSFDNSYTCQVVLKLFCAKTLLDYFLGYGCGAGSHFCKLIIIF